MPITNLAVGDTTQRGETVQEFCPVDPATANPPPGHWRCNTHDQDFPNNMMMDSHCSTGSHQQVWICHTHGAEAE